MRRGDLVWSEDPETGEAGSRRVLGTTAHDEPFLVTITWRTWDQRVVRATPEHPFYVAGAGWVAASALQPGDRVRTADGEQLEVADVAWSVHDAPVYNLTVEELHTYFVGDEAVWVHNGCFGASRGTGTVWDAVKATQPVYDGTVIPKSFELGSGSGSVWVHGNATEHLAEYATSMINRGATPEMVNLASQQQIRGLQAAVETATPTHRRLRVRRRAHPRQLKFAAPREAGQLPALIHALPQ